MKTRGRVGIIGGTFDPVHHGHLDAADAATAALGLDEIVFVPSHVPPHRSAQPQASAFHRFALLSLAIDGHRGHRVSDVELSREGRSFTIDTLRTFHGYGISPLQLFFIIGTDAFAEIATWYQYPAILDAANFAVIARPGCTLEHALNGAPEIAMRLRRAPGSGINSGNTGVIDSGKTGVFPIEARTRDVSATTIRARIAAGETIDDLVPLSVAHHIAIHHLYEQVNELHG